MIEKFALEEHQKEGIEWMWERVERKKGFILGDDMGMGKTRQVLEVIRREWSKRGRSVLILAPVTLLRNWVSEAKKFRINIEARVLPADPGRSVGEEIREAEGARILLMGYELALKKKGALLRGYFDLLVMDEAQRIKNRSTGISALCRRVNAGVKICVTGTPLQNSLGELWSLVETVRPGSLGSPERFKAEIEDPMKRSKLTRATEEEKERGAAISSHLKEILADVVIRRVKKGSGILLPEMKEVVISCPLTETQQKVYKKALEEDQVRATVLGKTSPLKTILLLRKICAHPLLASSKDKARTDALDSGKVEVVHRLVFQWRNRNRKVLIFSQYKEVLSILSETLRVPTWRIDGNTSLAKRAKIIEEFGGSRKTEVLLLTTKVGGVGLNIQKANTVILFDMDWNPFNDEQAKGRAHRIGQLQEVSIFRLICRGTIEDSISTCQQIKKDISSGVLEGVSSKKLFDKVDLCRLFHYSHDPADVTDISIY